jgi:2'-5' RNA ligase
MPYAIELYFDPQTDGAIRGLWQNIAAAGVRSAMIEARYRPHLSLAVCGDLDVEAMHDPLATFAATLSPFELALPTIGLFTRPEGVLFLGVTVTESLLALHRRFNHIITPHTSTLRSYYCVGQWVPHCTLAFGLERDELLIAAGACLSLELPLYATVQEIGISDVSPDSCRPLHAVGIDQNRE